MILQSLLYLMKLMMIWSILTTNGRSMTLETQSTFKYNPLNGQHLLIIWPRWEGNPKGLSGPLKGGVVIDYLSNRFNFTYEMVRVTENQMEPPENGRGLMNYLWEHKCDFLVNSIVPTSQRLKTIDLTMPWHYNSIALLIPASNISANTDAVIKPFQWPVWLSLGISIICVIFFLNCSSSLFPHESKGIINNSYLYVLGNLVSQGGSCKSSRLSFRIVAGVWCLATFIFVQAYTSVLFTFVIIPESWPLAESIYDVADSQDINLLVKKGGTVDNLILNSNQTNLNLYKKLKVRVDSYPESRCTLVSDCIKLITPGSRNTFADATSYQLDAIKEEFDKTGKCNMQVAKYSFMNVAATLALVKNSPYTQTISIGVTEILELGLIDYWDLWFRPMPNQCIKNVKSNVKSTKTKEQHSRLSLKNLTGAFVVLITGLSLSFLVFVHEQIVFYWACKSPTTRRVAVQPPNKP